MFAPLFQLGAHTHSAYSLLLFVAAIASFALGARVVRKEQGSAISRWFFLPALIMSLWLAARGMSGSANTVTLAEAWVRVSYLVFPLLPAAFVQFAFVAMGTARRMRALLIVFWLMGAAFCISAVISSLLIAGVWSYPWGYYPRYGSLAWLFLVYFGLLGAISLTAFLRAVFRLPRSRQRHRLTHFAIAYAAGFTGTLDFLPAYGIYLIPLGHFAALAMVAFLGRSIRRYQLFDITPAFAAENIVSTMADALIVTDDEGWIRIANDTACEWSGYTRAELVGAPLRRLLPESEPGDREWLSRDGAAIPVNVVVSDLRDGELRAGVVVIAHDLRERKKIEEAMRLQALRLRTEEVRREAELEYRTLIESMSDGIIHIDRNNMIRYINERAEAILGVERDDVIGREIGDAIGEELRDILVDDSEVQRPQVAIAVPGKSLRWIEIGVSPVLDERGAARGTICALTDVTEQRMVQQLVTASAREWRQTFDAIQMPLLLLDAEGVVHQLNRAAIDLASIGEEGIGKPIAQLGPHPLWAEIDRLAKTEDDDRRTQLLDPNGTTWDIALDEIGEAEQRRFIVAARDISAIVQLQESLRRSETMSALGALVGGVAHEVRNPLFAMTSMLDAFANMYGQREEYQTFSSTLRAQLDRVSNLLSSLIEFGEPAPTTLAVHPIRPLLDEAIAQCAAEAERAGVKIVTTGTCGDVRMNRRRMLQAFTQLIRNAVQHSNHGGTITVHVEPVERGRGEAWIACSVADEGHGFRRPDLPKVFEPFFTRRKGGIGLGLAIARAVVEQHHGTIVADNRPSGGAVVCVELPAA